MRVCEKCGGDGGVYDSRPVADTIMRRRKCVSCGHKWVTVETNSIRKRAATVGVRRQIVGDLKDVLVAINKLSGEVSALRALVAERIEAQRLEAAE